MPYDWRMNPYKCIACETRVQDCRCCDNGSDTLPFVVVIDGCGTFQGRYEFDAVRYRSPTALPDGVSYPAENPCGVFWGTLSAGDGCTTGGTTWGGKIGLLSWCDGSDPYMGIPWHVEVYCYDTYSASWTSKGEATVTSYECLCSGPRFAFTLPDLDCCCDGGPTTCAELEALGVPIVADDGTNQITLTYDSGLGYWTYSGSGTFAGCTDGSWVWQCVSSTPIEGYFAHAPSGQTCAPTGTLSPFDFSCAFFGCDGNPYTVTFTE